MSASEKQRKQLQDLQARLWSIANDLRGSMDANEFKSYILGLIFYRYLSERTEQRAASLLAQDNITYSEAFANDIYRDALIAELLEQLGYIIEPQFLYSNLLTAIKESRFDVELLQKAVNAVMESTMGTESASDFDSLFSDMDLSSTRLGRTVSERSKLMAKVIVNISEIPFLHEDTEIDVLGDAYEYLIGQFAASAGKKAGEFYTPQQVSKILTRLVTVGRKNVRVAYDPCPGSGSLLLRVAREAKVFRFVGQELNSTTYNLARMNMLLHGVSYKNFDIRNGNTIENPLHLDLKADVVVANPPYSANWSADERFLDDERFAPYGKLAPKSKADYAFIQHMIYMLDDHGTMAVVLPHGVLFRGAAEGVIRTYLIKNKNYLDAVIGLPPNLFYGTSIPTCILVFKKTREHNGNVLFIDASNDFEKGKNQNRLRDEDVDRIINTYKKRETVDKYSYVAGLDEIAENDYNLNIPRYVDTFEEEEPIDLAAVKARIEEVDKEIAEVDRELRTYFKELGI
jgi:type I restriction enzyme M protein